MLGLGHGVEPLLAIATLALQGMHRKSPRIQEAWVNILRAHHGTDQNSEGTQNPASLVIQYAYLLSALIWFWGLGDYARTLEGLSPHRSATWGILWNTEPPPYPLRPHSCP